MDNKYQQYATSVIKEIKFDLFNLKDGIPQKSCGCGNHSDLYGIHEPKRGGLIDPWMSSESTICVICQFDVKYCDGHSAHIDSHYQAKP